MDLFIIRHAQSFNNTLNDQTKRVVDPPLTSLGFRQAESVAEFVAHGNDYAARPTVYETGVVASRPGLGLTRLYCSAMLRALQTAQAIAHASQLRPHVWVDIHEEGGMWLDHGEPAGIVGYPGMSRREMCDQFPECVLGDDISDDGWWRSGLEQSDSFTARAGRVAGALRELAADRPDEHVALVTHGGFAAALLMSIFGVPFGLNRFFYHNNTGVTRIRYRYDGRISLRYLNRIDHLPGDLVS